MTYKHVASVVFCVVNIVFIRSGYLLWYETWLSGRPGGVQGGESTQLIRIAHAMGLLFMWLGLLGIWLVVPNKRILKKNNQE
jgi:hypothetical protein